MKSWFDVIDEVFSEMSASSFCSCHEGDLDFRYAEGVRQFKLKFADKVLQAIIDGLKGIKIERG